MRGKRGLLQNLGMLTASQIAAQLLNVWALVYLADRLGPHWFGVVQVGVAFLAYALTTAEWGMFNLGIREIARQDKPETILAYARSHTGIMGLQALVVAGLGLLVLPHLPFWSNDPWIYVLYLAAVLPQVFMYSWIGVGLERIPWVGVVKSLRSLVYAALILLLLDPLSRLTGMPAPRWVPLLFLTAMIAGNVVMGVVVRGWFGQWVWPTLPAWSEVRRRWRETVPLGAGIVVLRILLNVDLIMLGALAAPAMAGHYAAASRMIFLMVVAIEVLWSALLPRLSRLAQLDHAGFRRAFNLYLGFVLAGLLPLAVGGVLTGPDLVALFYGPDYVAAGPVFQVLAVSYSLLAVAMFLGNTLVAMDRQTAYFPPLLAAAVVAVGANAFLVPRNGVEGAAWGMLLAHSGLAVSLISIQRRLFVRRLGLLLALLVPAVLAMVLVVRVGAAWHVALRIVAGATAYLPLAAGPLLWFRRSQRWETT